jgi:hypothetical protein
VPFFQFTNITLQWNTIATNFVSPSAVATLAGPAIVNYVNSIPVGQPLNVFEVQSVFQAAVISILDPRLISVINVTVLVNGVQLSPASGTGLIYGDPQSYFETTLGEVTVSQA